MEEGIALWKHGRLMCWGSKTINQTSAAGYIAL